MMDAEFSYLSLCSTDKSFYDFDETETKRKVKILFSYGYFFDPHRGWFYNPYTCGIIKTGLLKTFKTEGVETTLARINQENLNSGIVHFSKDQLEAYYDKRNSSFGLIKNLINGLGGIYGVITLLLSIVFFFLDYDLYAIISCGVAIILTSLYYTYNVRWVKAHTSFGQSIFWHKAESVFAIAYLASNVFTYYLLYKQTSSWWIPVLILLFLWYIINRMVTNFLSDAFWSLLGTGYLKQFKYMKDYSDEF